MNTWQRMNEYGKKKESFLFLVDYEKEKPLVWKLNQVPNYIKFQLPSYNSDVPQNEILPVPRLTALNFCKEKAKIDIHRAQEFLKNGESYLLNLTYKIQLNNYDLNLRQLFNQSKSDYKFLWDDKFLSYSPECFIRVNNDIITTYPMKGTAKVQSGEKKSNLHKDSKEIAEHNTVVDLLRNDLNIISNNVSVKKYRFEKRIKTLNGDLIQTSSEISGQLDKDWSSKIGTIIKSITPAGSISGAPKRKTLQIIKSLENQQRGYYTGIFGLYHNDQLDTGILIRFIEKTNSDFFYRTGVGITINSDSIQETEELINKIYVPI